MFSFSSNHHNGIHSERFQRNNDKINIKNLPTCEAQERFKLPTSRIPRLYSVELLGLPFQPIKFHEKRKELIGVEDGLAPSTSCIYNRRSSY